MELVLAPAPSTGLLFSHDTQHAAAAAKTAARKTLAWYEGVRNLTS